MICKDCSSELKFVCNKCWTMICGQSECNQGLVKHKDVCPKFFILRFDREVKFIFWREYYKKEVKRISKQYSDISIKTKEIINTIEVLSKYALGRLENLKKKYLEILKTKNFETAEKIYKPRTEVEFNIDLSPILTFYNQFYIEDASLIKKKSFFKDFHKIKIEGHSSSIYSMAVSSDENFLVTGSSDMTIRVWDIKKKQQMSVLKGHTGEVNSVCATNDFKYIVSGSSDRTIRIWNLKTMKQEYQIRYADEIFRVILTRDNKYIISGSFDKNITIWSYLEKNMIAILRNHTCTIFCLAVSSENSFIVSGSSDNTIKIWDFELISQINLLKGHENKVSSVEISSNNNFIVSGSWDNTVRVWNLQGNCISVLDRHTDKVYVVKISFDNKYIFSGSSDKTVRIWNIDKRCQEDIIEEKRDIVSLVIGKISNNIYYSGDGNIYVSNLENKYKKLIFEGHANILRNIIFSKNCKYAVSTDHSRTAIIWNLQKNSQEIDLSCNPSKNSIAFSHDSKYFIYGENITIKIWDLENKYIGNKLLGHEKEITSVSISCDNKYIVSGSYDNTIRVWDMENKIQIFMFVSYSIITNVIFIGKFLASCEINGSLTIWDFESMIFGKDALDRLLFL